MPEENPQIQTEVAPAATIEPSEFDALINKEFRPKTDQARTAVQDAVKTLAEQAVGAASLISDDVLLTIESLVGEL
ncbi:MAG: type VI secretion system contractile sheath large subunit, partial [Verrucomicrobia bacterium]|nr:type VI secretion system contractile sheath large subunit [Verrucomicrobiota bacterium]